MGLNNVYDEDLIFNTSSRIPVCICLDISEDLKNEGSFPKEKELESEINSFLNSINNSSKLRDSVELCIVSSSDGKVIRRFTTVEEDEKINLQYEGLKNLDLSILKGYEELEQRKSLYNENGVEYSTAWMVIISGGNLKGVSFNGGREKINLAEENNQLHIVTVYLGDDLNNQKDELKSLSDVNNPIVIGKEKISDFFIWLEKNICNFHSVENVELDYSELAEWSDI